MRDRDHRWRAGQAGNETVNTFIPHHPSHALRHSNLVVVCRPTPADGCTAALGVGLVEALVAHLDASMARQEPVLLPAVRTVTAAQSLFHEGMVASKKVYKRVRAAHAQRRLKRGHAMAERALGAVAAVASVGGAVHDRGL